VEVTPDAWGRDPAAIARVAAAAGVDVVMGCAPGAAAPRAGEGAGMPAAWYRDRILRLLEGPGPRPGVIGEIGTGDPITPDERAALSGAAMAQAATGLALYVHLEPWGRRGHEALDLVEAGGGDPGRTVLCHLDALVPGGLDEHRSLMRRGAVVAFDRWGDETRSATRRMPTDEERLEATLGLIDDGLGDLLVHGQDVRTKIQLSRFGGPGYDHIPHVVGPMLREAGLEEAEVRRQLAGNALRVLRGA
jgi:phosphotriesterase-related protein